MAAAKRPNKTMEFDLSGTLSGTLATEMINESPGAIHREINQIIIRFQKHNFLT